MFGEVIPGNALVVDKTLPFTQLSHFGSGLGFLGTLLERSAGRLWDVELPVLAQVRAGLKEELTALGTHKAGAQLDAS